MLNILYRLCTQAYTSMGKAGIILRDHKDLAKHMNTIVFHTKMVDYLDEMLVETSDLSMYWLVLCINPLFIPI